MAYPFAPAPRFSELKAKLAAEGCEYKSRALPVQAEDGVDLGPINYFERDVNGEIRTAVVDIAEDEFVAFSVVRSICAKLGVDPKIFGLDLG